MSPIIPFCLENFTPEFVESKYPNQDAVAERIEAANEINQRGMDLYIEGRFSEAIEQFEQSLSIYQCFAPHSLELSTVHSNIGTIYEEQGKLNEALEQYEQGLDIAEHTAPESLFVAIFFLKIGMIYKDQGTLAEALVLFQKGLEIYASQGELDSPITATFYLNIGSIKRSQGLLEEALKTNHLAITILERFPHTTGELASVYNNMGLTYKDMGVIYKEQKQIAKASKCLDIALVYFQKSFLIYDTLKLDCLGMATCCHNIGAIYKTQGHSEKALQLYFRSLAIRERLIPYSLDLATSYNNMGTLLHEIHNNLDEALEFHQKSLSIKVIHAPDGLLVATSYHNIGMVLKAQNKFDEALKSLQKSWEIRERLAPNNFFTDITRQNIEECIKKLRG